jgi:hypothetical protein
MAIETLFMMPIGWALGVAAVMVLLRYAGILHMVPKQAGFLAAGVMFYVIDLAWNAGTFATKMASAMTGWLSFAWELIAFIFILLGALWAVAELIRK